MTTRVSLSEFARGKGWREKLKRNEFMELLEHGERRRPEGFYRRMAEVKRLALEGPEQASIPAEG